MKKYKTTKKHPCCKEGLIIRSSCDNIWIEDNEYEFDYDYPIEMALEDGWIEEIKEPEFTKDDMINFVYHIKKRFYENNIDVSESLELWLKQRDKDKKKDK